MELSGTLLSLCDEEREYHDGIYLVDGNGQGIRVQQSDPPVHQPNNNSMMIRISEEPICIQINQSMRDLNSSTRTVLVVPGGPSSAPAGGSSSSTSAAGAVTSNNHAKEDIIEERDEEVVVPPPVVNRRRSRNRPKNHSSRRNNNNIVAAGESSLPNYSTLPISNEEVVEEPPPPPVIRNPRGRHGRLVDQPSIPPPLPLPPPPPLPPPAGGVVTSIRSMLLNLLQRDKCCCCINQTVSIRWFIIVIFMIGICCTVTGTVLGATRFNGANNKEHVTLSLLMIGVGVVLLTVSGIAWKMTTSSSLSSSNGDCSAMLGLNSNRFIHSNSINNRNNYYGRPHPYSAMMYPELLSPPQQHPSSSGGGPFREPPPSYAASMQEYRLRLLLYERSNPTFVPNFYNPPPPYYHFHPNLMPPPPPPHGMPIMPIPNIHHHHHRRYAPMPPPLQVPSSSGVLDYYNSRPPSYRSRSSIDQPHSPVVSTPSGGGGNPPLSATPSAQPITPQNHHTRDPSIISYLSHQSGDNMSVVSEHTVNLQSPTGRSTVVTVLHAVSNNCEEKENNNVTIVQTNSDNNSSHGSAVIVTVSGNSPSGSGGLQQWEEETNDECYCNNSVQILAHL